MPSPNTIFILLLLLLAGREAKAQKEEFTSQPTKRNEYALVIYGGSGPGYYLSVAGIPEYLQPKIRKFSPVSTIRLMWHPDHLVRVGLETGYMTFVSYTLEDSAGKKGKVSLNAIPVLIEWSMALTRRFNVFAGGGAYFLNTRLNYAGRSNAQKVSLGWMAAVSYIHPLGKDVGLGTELKWLDAAESTDGSLCFQVQLVWKFLKW